MLSGAWRQPVGAQPPAIHCTQQSPRMTTESDSRSGRRHAQRVSLRPAGATATLRFPGRPDQSGYAPADWARMHSRPSGPAVSAISVAGLSHSMLSRSSGYRSAPTCAVPEPAAT